MVATCGSVGHRCTYPRPRGPEQEAARYRISRVPVFARHALPGRLQKLVKMSWVTLDRICEEERLSDEKSRRLMKGGNRLLRSSAKHLSGEELLDKLRGFGFDLDRRSLEQLSGQRALR
jgi:serine/threonine protein kinase HipA of HipAB toxin-antitoxin module